MLGDDLDGPTAAQVGLITRCVSRDELDDAVDRLAIRLADYSLQAQARTKHLLDATWSFALTEALAAEAEAQVANVYTPEFHRALNAFRTRHQGAQP